MFSKFIKFFPTEEIIKIIPGIIVDLLADLVDREITPELQDKAKRYLDIADKANEALDVVIEILKCIIDNKEIPVDSLERLERWATGAKKSK